MGGAAIRRLNGQNLLDGVDFVEPKVRVVLPRPNREAILRDHKLRKAFQTLQRAKSTVDVKVDVSVLQLLFYNELFLYRAVFLISNRLQKKEA